MPSLSTSVSQKDYYVLPETQSRWVMEVRTDNILPEFYEIIFHSIQSIVPHEGENLKEFVFKLIKERKASLRPLSLASVWGSALSLEISQSQDHQGGIVDLESKVEGFRRSLEELAGLISEMSGKIDETKRKFAEIVREGGDIQECVRQVEENELRLKALSQLSAERMSLLNDFMSELEMDHKQNYHLPA